MSTSLPAWHPRHWPWARMGILLAVVTLGGSQIYFNLILGNRGHFPRSAGFHAWVILWAQVLPAFVLLALDGLLLRLTGEGSRGLRLWRAFLYALTAFLLMRQAQVYHPVLFYAVLPSKAVALAYAALGIAVFVLSFRRFRGADRYFSVLGILALLLTARYVLGALGGEKPPAGAAGVLEPPSPGRPVVLLVFDEWSLDTLVDKEGRIDRQAFPRVAALADEGAWFPKAISNAAFTEASTMVLLTGRRHPSDRDAIVFERLRDTHRATVLMAWPVFNDWLVQRASKPGDRYFTHVDSRALSLGALDVLSFLGTALAESGIVTEGWSAPSGAPLPPMTLWDLWGSRREFLDVEVASFLGLLTRDQCRGRVVYWHCSQPHSPFRYDAQGAVHGSPYDRFYGRGNLDVRKIWPNYLEAARGVDRLVGLVVDRLKAEGLYEETTLIVTSDHGVRTYGLWEPESYPELQSGQAVRIPFLLRGPSIRPGVRDAEYQTMDFAPTLLDVLGVPYAPGDFDGVSAFRAERPERPSTFSFEGDEYLLDRSSGLWKRTRK